MAGPLTGSILEDFYEDNLAAIRREIKQPLSDAAEDIRIAIIRRTTDGRDIFGQPFEPYAKFTQLKKNTGPQPVTLVRTGQMLRSLQKFPIKGGFRIRMVGSRNKRLGREHQKGVPERNLPPRQWFGLSPSQRRRIQSKYGRRVIQNITTFAIKQKGGSLSLDFKVTV